jgi:hypothetical protein
MAQIKQILGLDISLGRLREAMRNIPYRLAQGVPCNSFSKLLHDYSDIQQLVAFTEPNDSTFLDWP